MPNYIDITKNQLNNLIKECNVDVTLTSGATIVHPGLYPNKFIEIGINPRDKNRNTLLGVVTSKTANQKDTFIVGITYEDNQDDAPNEDFFEVQINNKKIGKYKPSEFEKIFPEYKDMHRGLKDFFYE